MSSPAVQPLLALLASHVGGNPTQYMFEQAFMHQELDWRYLTFEVSPEYLGDAIRGLQVLGFRGGHCDDPHKQSALTWLDRTTETAALVGGVNLIFREDNALVGDNTEGKGLLRALRGACDLTGKRIVLFGAGLSARSVTVELAAAGVAGITVVDHAESHNEDLATLLVDKFDVPVTAELWEDAYRVPEDADVLIRADHLGHDASKAALPLVVDSLRSELLVADMTAHAPRTWLLDEADRCGCRTIDGLSMFIEQTAEDFTLWTGVDPDRQVLREAVEEFWEL